MSDNRAPDHHIDFTHPAFTHDNGWRTRAACADPHPNADWFPEHGHARSTNTLNALNICATCPVRLPCLRYALLNDRHRDRGIFGGLTAKQRTRLRAQLVARNLLPVLRTCANPHCRQTFQAKPTTPRENVCCSNECRLARRRLATRTP